MVGEPRVSIIMASYNHAPFVAHAIGSVLEQSFQDFEFVITDDGSMDGTHDVIRRYTDPRINFERFLVNQGACEATNRCIERARGEYIAVINSDDVFLPGKIAKQVAILDAEPELAAVFGLPKFIDESGEPIRDKQNRFLNWFAAAPANRFQWLRQFFLEGNSLCHPTVMIRRRLYSELGGYNISLRQVPDYDMWVRVCAHYEIRVLTEPLIGYRVLGDHGNVSWPTPSVSRRAQWEGSRVLRHYWRMDEEALKRSFSADIPTEIATRGLPMRVQLALLASTKNVPWLKLYALETIQEAVEAGVPGIGPKELHKLTGEIDLFGAREHNANRRIIALPKAILKKVLGEEHVKALKETIRRYS
jgi:glycosyltransferase involved in cell wall biosynthesis